VTKGKPWTVEEELRLKELLEDGLPVSGIAAMLSKTKVAVSIKLRRLGLKDDSAQKKAVSSSSSRGLELPAELPTVEEAARIYAGAMQAMMKPGVSRADLQKWKTLADVAWKYREFMADLIHYKELEKECVEWRRKYEELSKKYEEMRRKYEELQAKSKDL
jgi:hypothetical protein